MKNNKGNKIDNFDIIANSCIFNYENEYCIKKRIIRNIIYILFAIYIIFYIIYYVYYSKRK